jgi:DNA repair protein RecN (Recombination protein N)
MLTELTINNLALIDELSFSFGPGLNVLTGETGAGKSILVGAINLILGARAKGDMIRQGAKEAEVQALFEPENMESMAARLDEIGLPAGEELLIRRVISSGGRNRIYLNGAMATLAQLSALGGELVAISGQHEHQQLLEQDRQLLFLDQYGRLGGKRCEMADAFADMSGLADEIRAQERRIREAREKADLYEFQAGEISAAHISLGEDEELEQERNLIRNAEKIFERVNGAYERLYGANGAVIEILGQVRSDLDAAGELDNRLDGIRSQVEEAFIQLDDAANTLRGHLDGLTFDPQRLSEVEDRLAVLNRLKRKYGPGLADVIDYGENAAGHLDNLEEGRAKLETLKTEFDAARKKAVATADSLSSDRRKAAKDMSRAITEELKGLGMPHARFEIVFSDRRADDRLGPLGIDEIEFYISPNMGEDLLPLARIASGGELSRTMLGLKGLLAGQEKVSTIIFDEVDAGIGGGVAEVVGQRLKTLAGFHQIVCITHLPQIAAQGNLHFQVFKEIRGRRTVTGIRPLEREDRESEIARMLGGATPTDKTLAAARELLSLASM